MSIALAPTGALSRPAGDALAAQRRTMLAFLVWGFSALMIGAAIGPLQALNYGGINVYPALAPVLQTYYQGLTIHGVLNAYIFTFFVTCGLLIYLPARELGLAPNMLLWRSCFGLMAAGTLMLLYAMFDNSSSVLWTFYPPLKGSPFFYFGMTLVVLGSLLPLPILLDMRARWKARRPGEVTPLVTYMSTTTMLMWGLAGGGAAIELIVQLDPWSAGLVDTIDPIVGRTLFWWTGHPIVYFWLMPAYVSWYGLLSKQCGGKLVSDPMARLTFALLLVFSLPVGSHHQFTDPGFSPVWRGILTALTLSVALPSLITAFTIGLSLEYSGRLAGGRGVLGWFTALPWRNPSVAAQVLAMVTFIFGGAGGIVNGSWELNNIVHNTTWIPGHFHITVGTASALTFMGVAFWMMPHLTGRKLLSRRLALVAAWLWFGGMSVFALGMHWAGLHGVPRRAWVSFLPQTVYDRFYGDAHFPLTMVAVGGIVLWLATFCFYVVFLGSLFTRRLSTPVPIPFAQAFGGAESYSLDGGEPIGIVAHRHLSPLAKALEQLGLITAFTAVATAAAYVPIFWPFVNNITRAQGWSVW
ncbi:cytochrome C oxidase subunit I [Lichenibacterium minor]|uniref:Cytochrome C oxidase subunit I n=1 Tax=Lichenibacterium minor TaxID=2316528 RepID=A0A4Q2U845_9HYPH|nr:cbb3-type cytochrome c oxidase subunit I [Lichenibacterium minor]RYC31301.1 cytochrome C oxidase subunit I [Lichenibacterium minor]